MSLTKAQAMIVLDDIIDGCINANEDQDQIDSIQQDLALIEGSSEDTNFEVLLYSMQYAYEEWGF